jgi:ATP-binding cassette subfamily C protein LapB
MGAGKSTLLKLMAGLLEPQSGHIFLDEIPINMYEAHTLSASVSYVPQRAALLNATLRDNLIAKKPWLSDEEILTCLRKLGADELFLKHPGGLDYRINPAHESLSLGEQQLVGLIRGVITAPSVLLLDEPTGDLDNNAEKHFLKFVEDYNPAATLVVVTHKMALLQLVDRIIVLQDGKILADGTTEQVLSVIKKIKSVSQLQRVQT